MRKWKQTTAAGVILLMGFLSICADGNYVYTGNRILRSRVEEIHPWRVERCGNQE